ncbi:MAG TPA: bifunctional [glutamate--ammonia ligase]-adenylyl-L-tyrosine phosphorylase/[glutamate--ammonia-ligase] adenylyltransferase, partial [Salinisphaeraceae bacterium]|nr:bifunctional [glutamate--ammonia ligase]-adenylyl-L-tyrosine phosphorylase/[glutamate--ammonia-ligase] adenylyltransferase [Salinisphaeraceae bacterium]
VVSTTAMEKYYRTHGREWERYAWIKARPIAGDLVGGRLLLEKLRSFVYRHYLDYGTLESIRDMKTLIDREVARAQLQDNIKLGAGGIREIEFVAQGLQLIRGGQEPALQDHRLLPVLARLARHGHLRAETAQELDRMYRFLRRIENRLQMWADRQTHELPADPIQRAALAAAMGYADWPAFAAALAAVRESVHAIYQRVFSKQRAEEPPRIARKERLQSLWDGELSQEESAQLLAAYGFTDSAAICSALVGLRAHSRQHEPHDRGRRWMKRLIPLLFATAVTLDDPDRALLRTLSVITAVSGRSTYVALLLEYPGGLATLMRLCAASPWITRHISQQPVLLDTLLESDLYRPTERRTLAELLDDELAALPQHDLERRMDVLRRFTQRETLRIAAADVSDAMPLMIVSDHLTDLAEVVLNAALATAWTQMRVRYGLPRKDNGTCEDFCIIGYGKLGGFEMGYGSDLDLMFLYDGAHEKMTDGARQLSHHAYFTQLAQRLVHILSIRTPAGRAYEVDLRLRPGGDSGLLATHIEAFEPYQQARAWTWEHQALVRARVVAGSQALEQRFSAIRATALTRPRDVQTLAREVCSMRTRMRRNLDRSRADMLDVRHMAGGLIDIEFMAQFAVLRYGRECEELLLFPDTIRILETLESAGIADYTSTRTLVSAYRAYRRRIHKLALQEQEALIAADELAQRRSAVQALWQQWLEAAAG